MTTCGGVSPHVESRAGDQPPVMSYRYKINPLNRFYIFTHENSPVKIKQESLNIIKLFDNVINVNRLNDSTFTVKPKKSLNY